MKDKRLAVPWMSPLLTYLLLFLLAATPARAATVAWTTLGTGPCTAVALSPPPAPGSPSVILAAFTGDNVTGPAIRRSEDGGVTWTPVLSARGYSLATTPLAPGKVLVATDNGLLGSTDYGATWTMLNPTVRTFAAFNAGDDGILYGDNLRSLDGGATWTPMTGLTMGSVGKDFHLQVTAADPSLLIAFNGSPRISRDGGATWTSVTGNLRSDFYSVGLDPVSPGFHYVGYCNNIQHWYPTGTAMASSVSGDIYALAVDPAAPQKVFAAAQGGAFFYSGDHGDSWQSCTGTGEIAFSGRMIVDAATGRVYVPSLSGLCAAATAAFPVTLPRISVSLSVGYDNGTSFVPKGYFMPGQEIVLRARLLYRGTGLPVPGATAELSATGSEYVTLTTGPADAAGYAEARWVPTDPTPYKYTASVSAGPGGWDGVRPTRTFTVGPAIHAGGISAGRYAGAVFVPSATFTTGEAVALRIRLLDPNNGLPVPGATVYFDVSGAEYAYPPSSPSDAEGWAEALWTPTLASQYTRVNITSVIPSPGYVWDGMLPGLITFSVTAPPVPTGTVRSMESGLNQTVKKVTTFVATDAFTAGNAVVLRGLLLDAGTLVPIDGATATFSITGPSGATLVSKASVSGQVEVKWQTAASGRRTAGTPKGIYMATITSVTLPAGYVWDGALRSITFTLN